MHRLMEIVTLKSGERAEIWKITAPDTLWAGRLLDFLSHKGEPWLEIMRTALERGAQPLTMNFFEAVCDGQIVGNITVVESLPRPVGLLQHVFTAPEHRRKGIASALMRAVCRDFVLRGGRVMHLGTGYKSPAYWIYFSFGFRPICETGHMRWIVEPGFMDRYFAPGPVSVRDTNVGDWPLLEALYSVEEGPVLRSLPQNLYGQSSYEGPFLRLREGLQEGRVKWSRVLVKTDGAVVGHAAAWLQPVPGQPWMLEIFVHPNFLDQADKLMDAAFIPPHHKFQAPCDSDAWQLQQAFESAGLWREATFRRHLQWHGRWLDVHFYSSPWAPE